MSAATCASASVLPGVSQSATGAIPAGSFGAIFGAAQIPSAAPTISSRSTLSAQAANERPPFASAASSCGSEWTSAGPTAGSTGSAAGSAPGCAAAAAIVSTVTGSAAASGTAGAGSPSGPPADTVSTVTGSFPGGVPTVSEGAAGTDSAPAGGSVSAAGVAFRLRRPAPSVASDSFSDIDLHPCSVCGAPAILG